MARYRINPGEFKNKIEIQRCIKVKDDDNRLIEKWTNVYTEKAKILYTRGEEYTEAYGTNSNVSLTFYIRHNRKKITYKDRIIYKEKAYNIVYVNNIQELNKYYEIKAELVE